MKLIAIATLAALTILAEYPRQTKAAATTGVIRGVVTDEHGTPCAGAKVMALPVGVPLHAAIPWARTDARGRFVIKRLWLLKYSVTAGKESAGYPLNFYGFYPNIPSLRVTLSASAPDAFVRIRLGPKAGILTGFIQDSVTGALVNNANFVLSRPHAPHSTFGTGEPWHYRILLPASLPVDVKVSAPGYQPTHYDGIELASGTEKSLLIKLQPASRDSGTTRPVSPSSTFFNPDRQAPLRAHSARWFLSLIANKACLQCLNGRLLSFRIVNRRAGTASRFDLKNMTAQAENLYIVGRDRAAILGLAGAGASIITIIALPSGRVIDTVEGVWASVSPNHRFAVFREWFPRMIPEGLLVSDVYLAYDLARGPRYNRGQPGPQNAYNAGWPLYPHGTGSHTVNIISARHAGSQHRISSDGFFWLGGNTVAFTDSWHDATSLVVANLSQGIRKPRVAAETIDTRSLIDFAKCAVKVAPSDLDRRRKHPSVMIYVYDIRWLQSKPGWVRLTLARQPCLSTATFDMHLMPEGLK
jgi:hypothetical protein